MTPQEAIQVAIYDLIGNHRSEFDTLVVKAFEMNEVEIDLPPITMESVHADNLALWREIGAVMYPGDNPYEGTRDDD